MENVKHIPHIEPARAERHGLSYLGFKYGLLAMAAMMVYFFIMRAANLIQIPEYRFVNYLLLGTTIFLALREERRMEHSNHIDYLPGIGTGLYVSTVAAMAFSVFVFVYSKLDSSLVTMMKNTNPFGGFTNSYLMGVLVFSETFVCGAILSFIIMQFFKRNRERADV